MVKVIDRIWCQWACDSRRNILHALGKQLKNASSSEASIEVTSNEKTDNYKSEENIKTDFNHNIGVDVNTLRSKENTDNDKKLNKDTS